MSKSPNEKKIKEYFEKKYNQTGHSLEGKIEQILKTYFRDIRREAPFFDKDENKGRTIDFIVIDDEIEQRIDKKSNLKGQLELVIECKNLPDHAWIFSGNEYEGLTFPECLLTKNSGNQSSWDIIPYCKHMGLNANSFHEDFLNDKKLKKSNKRQDNLYSSFLKVIKATRYQKEIYEIDYAQRKNQNTFFRDWFIFQPLIIFSGRMYKTIQKKNEVKLSSIKFASLRKEYVSANYREILGEVHVVSDDWFEDYLQKLKNNYILDDFQKKLR